MLGLVDLLWRRLHQFRLHFGVSAEPPPLSTVSVVEDEKKKGVSVKTLRWQLLVLSASVHLSLTGEKQAAPSLFQERFQVKSPPSTYLTKIRSFYQDQGGVTRRVSGPQKDLTHPKT